MGSTQARESEDERAHFGVLAAIEYGLILVLVAVVVILILAVVGQRVHNVFAHVSGGLIG